MSDEQLWSSDYKYLSDTLLPPDTTLDAVLASTTAAGLPEINVSPPQGKFLHLLARFGNARNILEIGTLAGYSTIWLGRALPPDGRLITLEIDPKHADVARANIDRAGLSRNVEVRVGPALESLPKLSGPFDLTFIDADKPNIPEYFKWALKLSRRGSIIIVDNVVRQGGVIDPNGDAAVKGVRRLNDLMAAEKRVTATTIQTVGSKGYDGFAIALVTADP